MLMYIGGLISVSLTKMQLCESRDFVFLLQYPHHQQQCLAQNKSSMNHN